MNKAWRTRSLSFLFAAALAVPSAMQVGYAFAQDAAPERDGARCPHGEGHGRRHGPHGPRDIEGRVQHLTERLSLDANQSRLVREIFEEARAEHEALRARARTEEGPSRHQEHRALMRRTMERIDALLTPEQRETFEEMRARFREHRREHRGRDSGRQVRSVDEGV
jgi:Spy/CpxP family protein refolding chaperone